MSKGNKSLEDALLSSNATVDLGGVNDMVEVPVGKEEKVAQEPNKPAYDEDDTFINPLVNKTMIIKFVPKQRGSITDKKHVNYGGLNIKAVVHLTVPQSRSGSLKPVLTPSEQKFLESYLGLEPGTMNPGKKVDNYWANRTVALTKNDNVFDLSDPEDFIGFKIAQANNNIVAPSREDFEKYRKASYQFVITSPDDEIKNAVSTVDNKTKAYVLFSKFKDEEKTLIYIIRKLTGKSFGKRAAKESIYYNIDKIISASPDKLVAEFENPFLPTELLLQDAVRSGVVRTRNGYYYLAKDNTPLAPAGSEPTLKVTCEFLNRPENQELKMFIDANALKE